MSTRREDILDAFVKLVEHYGMDKTTMKDVAKEAGISVGTIYNDFASKEELIEAFVMRNRVEAIQAYDSLLSQEQSTESLLQSFVLKHIQAFNYRVRRSRGFYESFGKEKNFRYIGKIFLGARNLIKQELTKRIALIMERGVKEDIFEIEDIPRKAELFLDAFTEYWSPPLVADRTEEEIMLDAKEMMELLLRAIKKH